MLFIGDTHGKYDAYYELVKNSKSSFQLGDFGFSEAWNRLLYSDLNPELHKVGQGNHDPHNSLNNSSKHWTGRFGNLLVDNQQIFWIGGALSIDLVYRVGEWMSRNRNPVYQTWFANEQLSYQEFKDCEKLWKKFKPKVVASHTCPSFVIKKGFSGNKSNRIMEDYGWGAEYNDITSQFLDHLWSIHRPDFWIFGHFHCSYHERFENTEFRCLAELETFEF